MGMTPMAVTGARVCVIELLGGQPSSGADSHIADTCKSVHPGNAYRIWSVHTCIVPQGHVSNAHTPSPLPCHSNATVPLSPLAGARWPSPRSLLPTPSHTFR